MAHAYVCTRVCARMLIMCIFNLKCYHTKLILVLILYNYDACYHSFMYFLHWNVTLLKSTFLYYLGLIMFLLMFDLLQVQKIDN